MNSSVAKMGFLARQKLRWYGLLQGVLHTWVRPRILPTPLSELQFDPAVPVCYALDSDALSSLLILDRACREQGLPRPLLPLGLRTGSEPRAYCVMRRKKGLIVRRTTPRTHPETLKRLVDRVCEGGEPDIQVLPVTVLVGRAPDKESGLARIFFSESWEVVGRLRRLFGTLVHGRNTFVQFGQPLSLRRLADEGLGAARSLRKVARILRVHFSRVRAAAIGPDLSHRRTVIDGILLSPAVEKAIEEHARAERITPQKAWRKARSHAFEIAADYSHAFVRAAYLAFAWFWNRIYDGVELNHFSEFQRIAPNYEVIYVPCHRSHIDYMLVSYLVYHNGLVPPHIAAGVNLNLPGVGRLVRMGGAFFLRRSFRAQKLYAAVFNEYLRTILARGTSIEYFVEGTRSRTGRSLEPKGGMLSMTVRSYLAAPSRPILFQPIHIGYERLVEGKSYTAELTGAGKKSETLADLFKVFGVLRHKYGKAHVSFARPILLDELLDGLQPDWRDAIGTTEKPVWLNGVINRLGNEIITRINAAANVNPVNLLAAVMLATPKHAIGRAELLAQLELYLDLLESCPYSDRVTHTLLRPAGIVEYGFTMGVLESRDHPLGEIIALKPSLAVQLTYFRNNISHIIALPSLVAASFLNTRRVNRAQLQRIATAIYPYLRNELFLPWDEAAVPQALDRIIEWLQRRELLQSANGGTLERAEGGTEKSLQLQLLGRCLLQTFERYFITLAVLVKNGSGALTRSQLERLCILTAQRISQLSEFDAPEFYDRNLFRQFIELLKERGALTVNAEEKLDFSDVIQEMTEDAKTLLSKEIRHGIIRVAPQVLQEADSD